MTYRAIVAAGWVVLSACAATVAQPLNDELEQLIRESGLGSAVVGVHAIDLESGATLASLRPSDALIPASNMKLLASGAALDVLGESFAFRTELVLVGDSLVARGAGDPSLGDATLLEHSSPRMTVAQFLARLGTAVREGGVTEVSRVVVDDRIFDRQFVHPSWEPDDLVKAYAAPICGLSFHGNVVTVYPTPSSPGRPPTVVLEPESPWIEIVNKGKSVSKGGSPWVLRDPSREVFTLFGETSQRVAIDVALYDPGRSFGRLLAAELLRAGVSIGTIRAGAAGAPPPRDSVTRSYEFVEAPGAGETLAGGRVLAVISTPLADVLRRCNVDSSNLDAECLLKRIGHQVTREPGSWANGASVLRMRLSERLGAKFAAETVISDGSGLSRENRVSARTLAHWLAAMAEDEHAAAYTSSLATPGSGTLRRRFREVSLKNELFAKSGSIEGVRCLSGYLIDPESGRRIAFSILVNGLKGGQSQGALKLHERFVGELDEWLTRVRAAAVEGG